ncbi:MAG: c-type cytochrome [Dehalococcoidales bacterium]|nr:c-type cytochrome [Dehalococcoidales bacterium]
MKELYRQHTAFLAVLSVMIGLSLAACQPGAAAPTQAPTQATAQPTAAPTAKGASSSTLAEGQAVFEKNCNPCHPGGNAGAGPSLKRAQLTVDRIKNQVRNGGGGMPAFGTQKISDQQLDALAQYVMSLHQ